MACRGAGVLVTSDTVRDFLKANGVNAPVIDRRKGVCGAVICVRK